MVISSLIVECFEGYEQEVTEALEKIPGVEVHEQHGYKLVVTIEAETVDASKDLADSFINIPHVLNMHLIYVNFEDDPTINGGAPLGE